MTRRIAVLVGIAVWVFAGAVSAARAPEGDPKLRQKTFEAVWRTVKDSYYDPKLKGVDWKGAHDRYAPKVARAKTDGEFYELLRDMVAVFRESHFSISEPWSYADQDGAGPKSAPRSLLADAGEAGMSVCPVEDMEVVTRVEPGSPAARAGVRPGDALLAVDDTDIRELRKRLERKRRDPARLEVVVNNETTDLLDGWLGDRRTFRLLDVAGRERTVALTLEKPKGTPCQSSWSAGDYAWAEAKMLPGTIGYLRFNTFEFPALDSIKFSMAALTSAKALIIDLRGNTGGYSEIGWSIAGRLVGKRLDMGTFIRRKGRSHEAADPEKPRFDGPVAVLMDERTACASEILAVSLQEAGRAILVGRRSWGACEEGATVKLPDRSRLMYPSGLYKSPRGLVIEGVGLKPDILVNVTRKDLADGKDPILEAAIEAVTKNAK